MCTICHRPSSSHPSLTAGQAVSSPCHHTGGAVTTPARAHCASPFCVAECGRCAEQNLDGPRPVGVVGLQHLAGGNRVSDGTCSAALRRGSEPVAARRASSSTPSLGISRKRGAMLFAPIRAEGA